MQATLNAYAQYAIFFDDAISQDKIKEIEKVLPDLINNLMPDTYSYDEEFVSQDNTEIILDRDYYLNCNVDFTSGVYTGPAEYCYPDEIELTETENIEISSTQFHEAVDNMLQELFDVNVIFDVDITIIYRDVDYYE